MTSTGNSTRDVKLLGKAFKPDPTFEINDVANLQCARGVRIYPEEVRHDLSANKIEIF